MIRPRARLATIFVFLSLICVLLASWTASVRRQKMAVAELRELGCDVVYRDMAPSWLRRIGGDDLVARANLVMISSTKSDVSASIAAAVKLPHLEKLFIWVPEASSDNLLYSARLRAYPQDIQWLSELAGYDLDIVRHARPNCRIFANMMEYKVRPQTLPEEQVLKLRKMLSSSTSDDQPQTP